MFCKNCGKQLPDGAQFCQHCGTPSGVAQPAGAAAYGAAVRPKKKRSLLGKLVLVVGVLFVLLLVVGLLFGEEEPTYSSAGTTGGGASATGGAGGIYGTDVEGVSFRDNYTVIKGDGTDTWTIMAYVVGADLESEAGCATADMQEMLNATLSDNINIVLQTGGCASWQNDVMSDGEVQRWLIQNGELTELENLGTESMLTPESVEDFVSFAAQSYPANRQALIFWDHGGGSVYGYGSDELFENDVLYLPDIEQALENADEKFDFIGFDACLMGSMETAYMLEPFADYLIASEELEPGYGWEYTTWLTALAEDPSVDTVTLGTYIVDSFINDNSVSDTLSVTALREMPYVYEKLGEYMSNADSALTIDSFRTLSSARANTKAFADGEYDMIDLVDFAKNADFDGADALIAAVDSAVKYRNNCTVSGTHGMSMYFPYTSLDVYGYAKDFFSQFGFGGSCYSFYDSFVNILAGGQQRSGASSLKSNLTGESETTDYSGESWYDATAAESAAADDGVDFTQLEIIESGDNWILPLTDADWERLTSIELQVLLDDGEGYIDLGSDQTFETDEQDNLIISFDNTWVSIDGMVVPYYAESTEANIDDTYTFTGFVPATLNGDTDIEIILKWDDNAADAGYIAGYRLAGGNSGIGGGGTVGRGLKELKKGDSLQFVCDYYTYDGDYDASYLLGDAITIGDSLPAVTYEDVGESPVLVCFMLTDIYQNQSWTETVEMS